MLSPYSFGTMPAQPATWFQMLEPSVEYADFSYDATSVIGNDTIVGLSMSAMPSGPGEVALSRLALGPNSSGLNNLVTVWITGGVAGRKYVYNLVITTALTRIYSVMIGQIADPLLATCPIPPPPVPGFGTPITWPVHS